MTFPHAHEYPGDADLFGRTGAAGIPALHSESPIGELADRHDRSTAELALDDTLADSFPASDPPSWTSGVTRPRAVDS